MLVTSRIRWCLAFAAALWAPVGVGGACASTGTAPDTPSTKSAGAGRGATTQRTKGLPSAASSDGTAVADAGARDFETMFARFSRALSQRRRVELDGYVHSSTGLFVIGQPGTHVGVKRLTGFEPIINAKKPDPLTSLNGIDLDCDALIDAAFPAATCGPDGQFSNRGCFHSRRPTLLTKPEIPFTIAHFYESWLRQVPSVRSDRPDDEDRDRARDADSLITDGVYDTASGLGFFFGRVGKRWVLLAIDKTDYCEV